MVGRPADVVPWPARAATTATTGASRTTPTSLNRATERIIGVPLLSRLLDSGGGRSHLRMARRHPVRQAAAASYSGAAASAHQRCAVTVKNARARLFVYAARS